MKWYAWRLWRIATAPRKGWCAEITDHRGRWVRVIGSVFVLVHAKKH